MNERETERLLDTLRDIQTTLDRRLEQIDQTLERIKDELQERNS